jgi:hypothetical protein
MRGVSEWVLCAFLISGGALLTSLSRDTVRKRYAVGL